MSPPRPPLPAATFKERPEDFVVDEVPAYAASGQGDHLFVTFRKVGLTTEEAVRRIARALAVDPRDAGVAGQKDKAAVTTQTASFLAPRLAEPEAALRAVESTQLSILSVSRHGNKLKPGHLAANRFRVRLRRFADDDARGIAVRRLEEASRVGVPNHYGEQRFGAARDNAQRAVAFIRGERPPPRDKRQLRFAFSAFQSWLFNELLDRRVAEGTWNDVLPGDLAKKADTGGLFLVPDQGPELEEARERARALAISATGPMFGATMRSPEGEPALLEAEVLASSGVGTAELERLRHAGEGTRRALRLVASDLAWTEEADDLVVAFVLPKGAYATTLLGWVCTLARPEQGGAASPAGDGARDVSTERASEIEEDSSPGSTFG